jgi:hypothetical protein
MWSDDSTRLVPISNSILQILAKSIRLPILRTSSVHKSKNQTLTVFSHSGLLTDSCILYKLVQPSDRQFAFPTYKQVSFYFILTISLSSSIATCSRWIMVLILLSFQGYKWTYVSTIARMISDYVFPLCSLEFWSQHLKR